MTRFATVAMSVLALGLCGRAAYGSNGGIPHAPDDHFFCYKDKDISPAKFAPQSVTLADQFESGSYTVSKEKDICAPANVNNQGVTDANTHLLSYTVKPSATVTPSMVSRTGVTVVNEFHPPATPLTVDIGKGDRLLVPANKALGSTPPASAPDEMTINVDHYRCYKVKISKGQPKFQPIPNVMVSTQFDGGATRNYTLKKPSRLCAPTNKNGEGVKNALGHLMCYRVTSAKGQAKHTPTAAATHDQFGTRVLMTTKEDELCIPSLKNVPPPVCGNNVTEIGEQCDGTDDSACPGKCVTTFDSQPVCHCEGPHPFTIASGSNSIVRGVFGLDADLSIPLTGQFNLVNAPENPSGSGIIPLAVLPQAFPPISFLGMNVCVFLVDTNDGSGTAGSGLLNCNGIPLATPNPPSSDYRLFRDHCTQSTGAPSGCDTGVGFTGNCTVTEFSPLPGRLHAGVEPGEPSECVTALPPDPTCTTMSPTGGKPNLEVAGHCSVTVATPCGAPGQSCPTGETCVGHCSVTTTTDCSVDGDCPAGEVCGHPGPHPGACNSAVFFVPGNGTGAPAWAAQAAFIQLNLVIKQQSGSMPCSAHAGKCKVATATDCDRNLDCPMGDTCVTGAALQPFTTTLASSAIMDWGAASPAPTPPTVQAFALTGVNLSCVSFLNSVTSGAHLVSSLPALDNGIPFPPGVADLNLGTTFKAQ